MEDASRAVIIFALFSGKFGRKLVTFLIEYIAITIVDMMVMSVNMLVTGYEHNFVQSIIDNTFGMVLWIILTVLVYHKRKKVSAFIQTISYGYILLVLVFLLCVCVVAGTSYLVLNGEITQQAMRQTYFFNMLCIVVALVICVVLFYLVFSRKKVQHEKEIEEKVYEREWKRYQSMRSFRHDVKNICGYFTRWETEGISRKFENTLKKSELNITKMQSIIRAILFWIIL